MKHTRIVFDVGAHIGEGIDWYLGHGFSHVVAIEPLPSALEELHHKYDGNERVIIVPKAVSDAVGKVVLHYGFNTSLSTIETHWMQGRFKGFSWPNSIGVEATTLDLLIAEFGIPDLIKVDVEGHELFVFAGLSTPVEYIMFEYVGEFIDDSLEVVEVIAELGSYEFCLYLGENARMVIDYLPFSKFVEELRKWTGDNYGMIHARLKEKS